jgi:hypothetical protein
MRVQVFFKSMLPLAALAACTHNGNTPVMPAPVDVPAEMRVVAGDSTWVTRGPGYELVGRTRRDLGMVQPIVDRTVANFRRVFPGDTTTVIATVRPAPVAGQPFVSAPPTPSNYPVAVDLVLPDPHARRDDRTGVIPGGPDAIRRAVARALLAEHAARITGVAASPAQRRGEADDPRVPAWAEWLIPQLGDDSAYARSLALVTTHTEELIPLSRYFTMSNPSFLEVVSRGSSRGESPGRDGGREGGRDGTGGMRGGGMRGGRGGVRGGEGGAHGESRAAVAPVALFDAQSVVLGKYLSHDGYGFIAALVDRQIAGKQIDDLLQAHGYKTVQDLESAWRLWIAEQAGPG